MNLWIIFRNEIIKSKNKFVEKIIKNKTIGDDKLKKIKFAKDIVIILIGLLILTSMIIYEYCMVGDKGLYSDIREEKEIFEFEHANVKNLIKNIIDPNIKNTQEDFSLAKKGEKLSNKGYKGIKSLMFHCVGNEEFGNKSLFVSVSEFDKYMKFIKENEFTPIWFSDLDRGEYFKKPLLITFDDGYENNFTDAYPILVKYNIKATIFLPSNIIGLPKCLNKEQILKMSNLVEIQSHSLNHPSLVSLDKENITKQLIESKKSIEEITKKDVIAFAYPYGDYNLEIMDEVKKYYQYGVATWRYHTDDKKYENYQITRVGVYNNSRFARIRAFLKGKFDNLDKVFCY